AEATLSALREIIDGNLDVTLDTVAEVGSGRYPIIVVTMAMGRGRSEIFLSGTASLAGDRFWAAAKPGLQRLNRAVRPFLASHAFASAKMRAAIASCSPRRPRGYPVPAHFS